MGVVELKTPENVTTKTQWHCCRLIKSSILVIFRFIFNGYKFMELFQISCPCCQGLKCSDYSMYETKCDGTRKLVQCSECDYIFSETTNTLLFNLKTSVSRIALVLKSRAEGNEVSLSGFGRFSVSKVEARAGRNPQTGAAIQIKAYNQPKFKAFYGFSGRTSICVVLAFFLLYNKG